MRAFGCPVSALVSAALLLGLPASALGYGEPDVDGLPNRFERLLHVFTNQVRQAPHDWPGWDTSLATNLPRPPLAHQAGLAVAARFHADDMKANGCFTHESCDGTTFDARMSRYFSGAGASENLYSSIGDRSTRGAITGWMNSETGHRENLLTAEWNLLGVGWAETTAQLWYVQDFGITIGNRLPTIPAGAWEPRGARTDVHATFWDQDERPPREISAIVDGATIPLMHVTGPPGNETYSASVETPDSCVELYFVAVDDDGDQGRYPSTGALLFGDGCTAEFSGTAAPRPGRPIVDADEPGGCTALEVNDGGLLPLLLLGLLLMIRKQR